MTEEEFNKIPFNTVAHISGYNEHTSTYASPDGRLGYCVHTKKTGDFTFGRSYVHYRIDNNIYKTKERFLEALKEYKPGEPLRNECEKQYSEMQTRR